MKTKKKMPPKKAMRSMRPDMVAEPAMPMRPGMGPMKKKGRRKGVM
jgi:hypothetical protein